MRLDLAGDPAVIAMTDRLHPHVVSEEHMVGILHKFWSWANEQTQNGNVPSVTKRWIERYIGVTGFAQAMQDVGWLVVTDAGIEIPNFDNWNSQSAKKRILTAKRVRKHRQECNASVTQNGQSSVTKVLPEERRGEDRREENKSLSTDSPVGDVRRAMDAVKNREKAAQAKAEFDAELFDASGNQIAPTPQVIIDAYPAHRRTGGGGSIRAVQTALDRKCGDFAFLMAAVQRFAEGVEAGGDEARKYCPGIVKWFDEEWYDNEKLWHQAKPIEEAPKTNRAPLVPPRKPKPAETELEQNIREAF